jgi:serine/threonine protein kinase
MVDDSAGPRRVGRFEVIEVIEEGVTGILFRARDTESDKPVLLKAVAPLVSQNPAFGRYFYDKWAGRKSAVEHPNVLGLLDVGKDRDLYYVAVEDAGGRRLADRMDGSALPVDDALDLVRQMAEGLRAVHRRDIVHGHLKPSDVILTTDG